MTTDCNAAGVPPDAAPAADESSGAKPPAKQMLLDLRGSVPADGVQDFAAIWRLVLEERARRRTQGVG